MHNLRTQLLLSHLVLIGLMLVVMVGGVANVLHLGRSIGRILWNNQRSVIAAQELKEALERHDSAATFVLAGQTARARRQYEAYRPRFEAAYDLEANNITERGEKQTADDIGRRYASYQVALERLLYADPPMPTAEARAHYFGTLEPAFMILKQRAQDVLDLNQRAIQRADARAKAEARRAAATGVAVAAVAFAAALLLALRMVSAALLPLRIVARQADEIGTGHLNQRIELRRSDEIGALAASFNQMAEKLHAARRLADERLHRAERMSDAAIDSLYDPVLVTDAQGCVAHLNHAAEGLFGSVGDAAGRPVAEVAPDPRLVEAVARAIHQERVSADEGDEALVHVDATGGQRSYRLRAAPMRDDEGCLLGAVVVLEDVTHLREIDRLKSEFVGVASHELRTPVTSLQLAVQLLNEEATGELNEDQRKLVSAARDDVARLEAMTRDLLDLARLEASVTALRLRPVAPRQLMDAAVEAARAQAETKGLTLGAHADEGLPAVHADPGQVERVLANLLSNAIRHTPAGGSIRIVARQAGDAVAITVRDTGTGIPPEYLDRVFDRFVQVPGATRGGAGLGLSIARTIARAHAGDVTVESRQGEGSAFSLTLPVAGEGQGDPTESSSGRGRE